MVSECERYLAGVQVGGVLHGAGVVAVVPLFDDGVKQVCEYLKTDTKCIYLNN